MPRLSNCRNDERISRRAVFSQACHSFHWFVHHNCAGGVPCCFSIKVGLGLQVLHFFMKDFKIAIIYQPCLFGVMLQFRLPGRSFSQGFILPLPKAWHLKLELENTNRTKNIILLLSENNLIAWHSYGGWLKYKPAYKDWDYLFFEWSKCINDRIARGSF